MKRWLFIFFSITVFMLLFSLSCTISQPSRLSVVINYKTVDAKFLVDVYYTNTLMEEGTGELRQGYGKWEAKKLYPSDIYTIMVFIDMSGDGNIGDGDIFSTKEVWILGDTEVTFTEQDNWTNWSSTNTNTNP